MPHTGKRDGPTGAEKALLQSEERYRALFTGMTEGFAVHELLFDGAGRAVDYRFLDVNPAFERLTGLARETIVGHTQREVLPDEDSFWLETYAEVVASGEPVHLEHYSSVLRRHFGVFAYRVGYSGFATVFSDITERKKAEAERLAVESRLRMLVDILQHPAEDVQEFLDYALEQAIGLTDSKIGYIYHYSEATREFVLNSWSKHVMPACGVENPVTRYELDKTGIWGEAVRQRKSIVVNDFTVYNPLRKGYPPGHVELRRFMTVPVFKDGNIVGVVGLANKTDPYGEQDVLQTTLLMEAVWRMIDKIRAEADVRHLLAEKETLLKEVHHRIKNNMAVIRSILSLQAGSASEKAAATALEDAAGRIYGMMVLYDELYRSEDFHGLRVDEFISAIADNVVSSWRLQRTVGLEKDLCEYRLEAGKLQSLGIVVNELVTNSMKYAFEGRTSGTIALSARLDGNAMRVVVSDDGVGVPASVDPVASPGFGLTLVTALARQLDGSFSLTSGNGTRAEFSFPVDAD